MPKSPIQDLVKLHPSWEMNNLNFENNLGLKKSQNTLQLKV